MPRRTPIVGESVHLFLDDPTMPIAAMITRVIDPVEWIVMLTVFPPGAAPAQPSRSVAHALTPTPGHWTYPEGV